MFEIQPSPEFSAWFEDLSAAVAEEVACSLEVLAAAGVALDPSHASRALLWFDGTGDGVPEGFEQRRQKIVNAETAAHGFDTQELLLWQREIVRCLESDAFRRRLAQLEDRAASLALTAVENLKRRVQAARMQISLAAQTGEPQVLSRWARTLTAREERVLAQRFGIAEVPEVALGRALKEAFFEVLRLVGLEPSELMNSASGLCELTIVSTEPKLHVLFGLDAPAKRIVVLLGEPLTRSYYGDSARSSVVAASS
jgi:hypothetical protein